MEHTHGIYRSGPREAWGPCRVGSAVWNGATERLAVCTSIQEARELANKANAEED